MKAFPWRLALFVSLALNLLVIGAIVGWRIEAGAAERAAEAAPAGGAFMQTLPRDERIALRRALRRAFVETRELRRTARRERAAVMELATAETYDAAAVREALRRMRAADAALMVKVDDAVVAALADLPAEHRRDAVRAIARERAAIAQRMLERRLQDRAQEAAPAP